MHLLKRTARTVFGRGQSNQQATSTASCPPKSNTPSFPAHEQISKAPLQLGSGTQFPTREQVGCCGRIQSLALQKQTCFLHAFFPIIAGWTSQQPSLPHSCLGFLRPMTAWNKVVLQHEPLTLKCFHKGPLIFFVL